MFSNMDIDDQAKEEEHFVSLVYNSPILWNNKRMDFKCRDKKEAQWCRIGQDFGISGDDAKFKFLSLRQKYNREKQILKEKLKNGSLAPRAEWYLFDSLKFLDDVITPRKPKGSRIKLKTQQPHPPKLMLIQPKPQDNVPLDPLQSSNCSTSSPYTDEIFINIENVRTTQSSSECLSSSSGNLTSPTLPVKQELLLPDNTPTKLRKKTEPEITGEHVEKLIGVITKASEPAFPADDWPNVSPEVKIFCKYMGTLLMRVQDENMIDVQAKIFQVIAASQRK